MSDRKFKQLLIKSLEVFSNSKNIEGGKDGKTKAVGGA